MNKREFNFKVTIGNRKLGGGIYSINLPAIKTCRSDAPCKSLCYANKGNFRFPAVVNCYENNLKAFRLSVLMTKYEILEQLPQVGICRLFASGDFVNMTFLKMICDIASISKGVKFMAFTKKYQLINQYLDEGGIIPSNLKIVFSGWHGLEMVNPYNFPTAYVNLKGVNDKRIRADALPCGGRCDKCLMCWNMEKGQQVIFNQH